MNALKAVVSFIISFLNSGLLSESCQRRVVKARAIVARVFDSADEGASCSFVKKADGSFESHLNIQGESGAWHATIKDDGSCSCTCPDAKRVKVCKHLMALAGATHMRLQKPLEVVAPANAPAPKAQARTRTVSMDGSVRVGGRVVG